MVDFSPPPIQMNRWKKWMLTILGGAVVAFAVDFGSRVAYGTYIAPHMNLTTAQKEEVKIIVGESAQLVNDLRTQESALSTQLTAKTVELSNLQQSFVQMQKQNENLRQETATKEAELRTQCMHKEQELRDINKQLLKEKLAKGIDLYKIRQQIYKTVAQKIVNKTALADIDKVISEVQRKIVLFEKEGMIDMSDANVSMLMAQYMELQRDAVNKK